ncbi:MAG: PilZ domain-containing protein [Myxococcota bacterium]|nr:PilZ domain-containing protein [Myxococcales bacterium]
MGDDANEATKATQRYRRVALQAGVRISTIDPELEPHTGRPYFRTSEDTCGNVSRGGAYVESDELVSPGRRVLVEIDLPEGAQVRAVGRVRWTKTAIESASAKAHFGMGIEFVGAEDGELDRLERVLEDVRRAHGEPAREDSPTPTGRRAPSRA